MVQNTTTHLATYIVALPLLLICQFVHAQEERSPVHGGVYAGIAVPSAAFKEAVDNGKGGLGIGLDAHVLANPFGKRRWSPVYLGGGFQYISFGRDKIAETSSAPPYKTSFNYYGINGLGRLLPFKRDGFTIFLDGMLGLKIMNARTKIDKNAFQSILDENQPEVINNATDTGLSYGAGIGFFTKRYSIDENGDHIGKASFSLRVAYIWGDKVSHVRRGSLQVENGFVTYEEGHAPTDMIQLQIGAYIF